ncbi:hypothetical protein ABPG75_013290 [Micractinium tetrahymenae]
MPLLQCGFLANEHLQGAEPANSHQLASATPVPVSPSLALARPAQGGWGFALAAAGDRVYSWGVNSATVVAKAGANEDGADPADLDEVSAGVSAAAAGFDHGLLVLADGGKVLAFGPSLRPAGAPPGIYLLPVPFKVAVAQVAAGEHHSLALSTSGDVYAWGSNAEGQLGDGTTHSSAAPVLVAGPGSGARDAGLLQPATGIAAGARHSLAVNALGQCVAWGWGLHGQCGGGRSVPSVPTPAIVAALGPLKCASVAGGMGHTVVATDSGDVYAWGLNTDGQLGDGGDETALQPKLVESPALAGESVTKVAAGSRHTLLLTSSGKAFACGWGAFGQLGTGKFGSSRAPAAVAVPAGAKVADVAAGWWHSLILTE